MKTTTAAAHALTVITVLLLGASEDALGATGATIGLNFTGADDRQAGSGYTRPDSNGAVGPHHIVEMLNGVYTVYDKANGQLLQRMSLTSFWSAAGAPGGGLGDPRVVYDPTVDRWYAVSLEGGPRGSSGIDVAVSISGEPTFPIDDLTRGWRGFVLDGDPFNEPNTRWSDFPSVGFDANGVYITAALRDLGQSTTGVISRYDSLVVSIPKADLLLPSPTAVNGSMHEVSGADDVARCATSYIQPAIDVGPSDGSASMFAINSTTDLRHYKLANTGAQSPGSATLSGPSQIAIERIDRAPSAKQPGGVDTLFGGSYGGNVCSSGEIFDLSKFRSVLTKQGDSIWGTLAVDADDRAGIRWYELDAKTGAVRQQGTVSDPLLDLIFPSIAVNKTGDVVIGFTATGETKFPSAYAVVGNTNGGTTTFGDLLELKAGTAAYDDGSGRTRSSWGDYSTTVLDPSDPYSFWTFQEFTQAKDRWAVQITQILLPGADARPDAVAVGPAAAYSARDNVSNGLLDGLGDGTTDAMATLTGSVRVGETDATANRLGRFVTKFELPGRGADASDRLQNAVLRVFLENTEGTPAGPLSVLHSLSDNDLDRVTSDYEDASYTDTGLGLFQPTDAVGRYYDVDVTELVRADYSLDATSPLSAFRLQINDASFLEDGLSNRYVLTSAGTGRPELLLTFLLTGDFNGNGVLDIGDLDDLTAQSAGGGNPQKYDLNADASVNSLDVQVWVKDLDNSWIGDANLDGEFNSSDFVEVLASGMYEADVPSVWSTGDFNGDGRTDSGDLVVALADGGYEQGPRPANAAVPEPASALLILLGILSWPLRRRVTAPLPNVSPARHLACSTIIRHRASII